MMRRFVVLSIVFCALCSAVAAFPLKGKVVDTNGKPVAGIRVDVTERSIGIWGSKAKLRETVFTDKAGVFTLKDLDINADSKTYPPPLTFVPHQPGKLLGCRMEHIGSLIHQGKTDDLAKGITVVVAKPVTREGKVTDESGKPVAGARVEVESLRTKKPDDRSYSAYAGADDLYPVIEYPAAVTDDSGVFRIANIPENDAVMGPGGSMRGRVVDGKGGGVPGALVTTRSYSISGTQTGWGKAISAEDGSFRIDGLMPGDRDLSCTRRSYPAIQIRREDRGGRNAGPARYRLAAICSGHRTRCRC